MKEKQTYLSIHITFIGKTILSMRSGCGGAGNLFVKMFNMYLTTTDIPIPILKLSFPLSSLGCGWAVGVGELCMRNCWDSDTGTRLASKRGRNGADIDFGSIGRLGQDERKTRQKDKKRCIRTAVGEVNARVNVKLMGRRKITGKSVNEGIVVFPQNSGAEGKARVSRIGRNEFCKFHSFVFPQQNFPSNCLVLIFSFFLLVLLLLCIHYCFMNHL